MSYISKIRIPNNTEYIIRDSDAVHSSDLSGYVTTSELNTALSGKSNTGHTHDDRYYTESEVDTKLNNKISRDDPEFTLRSVLNDEEDDEDGGTPDTTYSYEGVYVNSDYDYTSLRCGSIKLGSDHGSVEVTKNGIHFGTGNSSSYTNISTSGEITHVEDDETKWKITADGVFSGAKVWGAVFN